MNPFKFGLIGKTPPGKLRDIFKHLTREKIKKPTLPDVFPASEAQIPEKTLTRDMFREAQERFKNAKAGGGMLVQPSADGSRPGYAKDERGFGSEKGARFKSPSKNQLTQAELITLLEKELGPEYKFKRGSLSGDPKSSVKGGQRANYLQNMLKDLLDRKAVATRGEQVRFLFNKPNAQQLDFIKTFIDSPFLSQQTVRNMEILDKKFGKKLSKASGKKFFMKELTIDMARKTLEDAGVKDVTTSKLARAMTRLAQQYQGRLFRNQPNIKINKKAGNFIFKSFNELDQYHPWRQGSYEAVLDDIDAALGKKVGKISAFKTKFKEKMQVRYPDRKFNFNEIFSISTSANRGSYPYAYFVDLTEDAMNKGALSSLQGKASIAEGKIQNNITKYRRTGNIKFYNEAVRVADVYNNTTRQNFLDSKKVLDYERKYGIKPNAYKIEIGSQRQVSDKLNFAKNFYKNSDLNKWKNMGIDIDAHSGQKGYVKAFDTKTLPKNIVTAPELFTKESVLRETKIIDDKKLNEFFNKNKKLIAVLGGGNCGRIANYQGGRVGLQDGTPSIDVCYDRATKRINSGFKNATPAEARNYTKLLNTIKSSAVIGKNLLKFGIVPEALFVGADSLIRVGFGDTFKEAGLRAADFFIPDDQTRDADVLKAQRTLGNAAATNVGKVLDYRNQIAKIDSLESQKQNLKNLSDVGEFDYIGDLSQDVKNIDTRLNQAKNNLQNKFMVSEAETVAGEKALEESYDISKAKSPLARLQLFARNIEGVQDDPFLSDVTSPEKTQMDLNLNMLPKLRTNIMQFKTSDAINLAQQLRAQGQDVSAKDVLAYRDQLKEMPLMDAANQFGREQVFGTQGTFFGQPLAGGGIAKLAGVDSGPPPASGPNSQGLQGLMKRVKNL